MKKKTASLRTRDSEREEKHAARLSAARRAAQALLWPNVKNGDLGASDMRTDHEALPPLAGLKYAANLWLHQFDFRGPNAHGCDLRVTIDPAERAPPLPPNWRPRVAESSRE